MWRLPPPNALSPAALKLRAQTTINSRGRTDPPGTDARFLYYWAKAYCNSLGTGEDYTLLRPTISVLWFKERFLTTTDRFHSVFRLLDVHASAPMCDHLEIHVLELPKLNLANNERRAKLERWARFLRAETPEEFEELAAEDPIMSRASRPA